MLDNLSNLVAVLVALSVATERLVDIIKNIVPWLRTERADASTERWRKVALQVLAVVVGMGTAYLASAQLLAPIKELDFLGQPLATLALGLLASGGSSFWTSIQGYVSNVKEVKKAEAVEKKVQAAATVAAIARGLRPALSPTAQHALQHGTGDQDVDSPDTRQTQAEATLRHTIDVAMTTLRL